MSKPVAAERTLLRKLPGIRDGLQTTALAFAIRPTASVPVRTLRATWSLRACGMFAEIARQARPGGTAVGRMLPHSSLRAALLVRLPDAMLVAADLGEPWSAGDRPAAFLDLADGDAAVVSARIKSAFAAWFQMVLSPWAERAAVSETVIEALADCVDSGDAVVFDEQQTDIRDACQPGERFDRLKHAVLQVLGQRLEGQTLFDGLGPVRRVVRNRSGGNELEFQTWPVTSKDAATYSMLATFAVETQPFGAGAVITVRASRRRWMDALPEPGKLLRQRRLTAYLMGKSCAPRAVEFSVDLEKGVPDESFAASNPAFVSQLLELGQFPSALADMAARRHGDVFVGVPYSPHYGSHAVGAGASTLDQIDLFDASAKLLAADGFVPLGFREVPGVPSRSAEYHKAATLEMLVGDVARALGHNDVSETAVSEAFSMLTDDAQKTSVGPDDVRKAEKALPVIRDANAGRVRRAFQHGKPTLVLMARTERERQVMRDCVQSLFGGALRLVERALPAATHGPRTSMPEAKATATKRFEARKEAWRTEAEALEADFGGCYVLVQAADWYSGQPDDPVNKLAGRCTLATDGNANVQYLLPPGNGERGLKSYLIRIQSAVYDLVFGHAGLVTEIGSLVAKCFPDTADRPLAVMGVSVISQARSRAGTKGGKVCLATRIDVANGLTTARLGWFQGHMRWSASWKPFNEILKDIAQLSLVSIGGTRPDEASNYQKFVRAMVDEPCAAGDRPLIMFNSGSAAGLWPWLTDDGMKDAVAIGGEMIDVSERWVGARLLRVRTDRAGRIVVRKQSAFEELDSESRKLTGGKVLRQAPTITAKVVQIGEGPHYWSTSGYLEQITRGLSVYRVLAAPARDAASGCYRQVPRDLTEEPYRLPNPVEISVGRMLPTDDADRIAGVVHSLRYGYGHTPALTTLPAPLSFESKVRDYMARLGVAEADADDVEAPDTVEDATAPPPEAASDGEDPGAIDAAVPAWADRLFPARPTGDPAIGSALATALSKRASYREQLLVTVTDRPKMHDIVCNAKSAALPAVPGAAAEAGAVITVTVDGDNALNPIREDLVPSFLDIEWLRERVVALPQTIRLLHEKADFIRKLHPDADWPERKPTTDEFLRILLFGFRSPSLFAVLSNLWPKTNKRLDLFKGFLTRCHNAADQAARDLGRKSESFESDISILVESKQEQMAYDTVLAWCIGTSAFVRETRVAHLLPSQEVRAYLDAVEEYWALIQCGGRTVADNQQEPVTVDLPSDGEGWETSSVSGETSDRNDAPGKCNDEHEANVDMAPGQGDGRPDDDAPVTLEETTSGVPPAEGISVLAVATAASGDSTVEDRSLAVPDAGEGMVIGAAAWERAVEALAHLILGSEPSKSLFQQASALLAEAGSALDAYEAAKPRFVAAGHLVARLLSLVERANDLDGDADCPIVDRSDNMTVLGAAVPAVTAALDAAEAALDDVTANQAEEESIWVSRDRSMVTHRIPDLHASSNDRMTHAVECMREAVAALAECGRARPTDTLPPVTLPPRGRAAVAEAPIKVAGPTEVPMEPEATAGANIHPSAMPQVEAAPAATDDSVDVATIDAMPTIEGEPFDAPMLDFFVAEAPVDGIEFGDGLNDDCFGPSDGATDGTESSDVEEDPEVAEISARLDELYRAGEFGLAWHLARAAQRAIPEASLPLQPGELAMLAAAGHMNHSAPQSSQMDTLLADALDALLEVPADGSDRSAARSLGLFLAGVELAVFQINSNAAQLVERAFNGLPAEIAGGLFQLKKVVLDARSTSLTITPQLLRSASSADEADRQRGSIRDQVLNKIQQIQELRFSFIAGSDTCAGLCKADKPLGKLRMAVTQNGTVGVDAARAFCDAYPGRSEIIDLVVGTSKEVSPRDPIDGPARDRLIGHVLDLTSLCADYVAASMAAPQLSNKREMVMRFRNGLTEGAAEALAVLSARVAENDGSLVAAVALRMSGAVSHLLGTVRGTVRQTASLEHLAVRHGPLLLFPELDYGRSWLPAPYDPSAIVAAVMSAEIPVLPADGDQRTERFARAVHARIARGSFGGALLALDLAPMLEIPANVSEQLREEWDGQLPFWKGNLQERIDLARLAVEKLQRTIEGDTERSETERMLAQIDALSKASLPVEIDLEARTEDEDLVERVLDLSQADFVLDDIETRVRAMLSEPRTEVEVRLEHLAPSMESADVESVRGLIHEDDLITARERLDIIQSGGRMPRTKAAAHPRFAAFFPRVPDFLAKLPEDAFRELPRRIEDGVDVGPLRFSQVAPEGREDARVIYDLWRKLPKLFHTGDAVTRVVPAALDILQRFGFKVLQQIVDQTAHKRAKQIHVANVKLTFPADDRESMLLPDYGSQTDGNYRLVVSGKMLDDSEIAQLTDAAGLTATILLVTARVPSERRNKLAVESASAQGGRKVLVIDEAILLFALAEPDLRPLTLIELAQPFGRSQPYDDYGRYATVPREMFFGRKLEHERVLAASGSSVVYGGRRLGKTALLRHIEMVNNKPEDGVVVAYVMGEDLGVKEQPVKLWHMASESLAGASEKSHSPVFKAAVPSADAFNKRVRDWLDGDSSRRILLLLDEANNFVKEDAQRSFEIFRVLLRLMDETNRRFKFVMAGLHNVTRLVHAENSPLRQITSDPQRIGPLMGADLAEAEALIVKPMASLGFTFERISDIWSILSATNYYPVLVQMMCMGLLEAIRDEARRTGRLNWVIRHEMVRHVLANEKVLKNIQQKFEATLELDRRYELLTYVIGGRSLHNRQEGRIDDGMTPAQVMDDALAHWPQGFDRLNRLAIIEELLDEMEGLGVLRRVGGDRWALRSPTVLSMLGGSQRVRTMLAEFRDRKMERPFEPGAMRRELVKTTLASWIDKGQPSPLTYGQEHDLLTGDSQVTVFFGNAMSDIDAVGAAVHQAASDPADQRRINVDARNFNALPDLLGAIKAAKESVQGRRIIVVQLKSEWNGDWIAETLKLKQVRDRQVRLVFVGGPKHALRWIDDPRMRQLPPSAVGVTPLQTWAPSAVEDLLKRLEIHSDHAHRLLLSDLGGFNKLIRRVLRDLGTRPTAIKLERSVETARSDDSVPEDLGLIGEMGKSFGQMSGWVSDGYIAPLFLVDGILSDVPEDRRAAAARRILEYGSLVGILEPGPLAPDAAEEVRPYAVNPMLCTLLKPKVIAA